MRVVFRKALSGHPSDDFNAVHSRIRICCIAVVQVHSKGNLAVQGESTSN